MRQLTIEEAKELAEAWQAEIDDAEKSWHVSSHFNTATPVQVVRMWETRKNLEGRKLSKFEFGALVEAWYRVFNCAPPSKSPTGEVKTPPPKPELPPDDTTISAKEVARLTGISLSTIKRMVGDGRFPPPMQLSEWRIGWPARDVREWLAERDEMRWKRRV
jgi:excisionase family DNA binding protein